MHNALLIPEILEQIFQVFVLKFDAKSFMSFSFLGNQIWYQPTYRWNRLSLLHAALTCRAFKDPALDALWSTMEKTEPIFDLICTHKTTEDGQEMKEVKDNISDGDIETFFSYSKRIKLFSSFRLSPYPLFAGHVDYIKILEASNHSHLFPSLKYLACQPDDPLFPFLLSPTLRILHTFTFSLRETSGSLDSEKAATVKSAVTAIAQGLVGLTLHYALPIDCLNLIGKSRDLEKLEITNIFPHRLDVNDGSDLFQLMQKLSSLSKLTEIKLHGDITFQIQTPTTVPVYTFSALKSLDLQADMCGGITDVTALLRIANFPMLESLSVDNPCFESRRIMPAATDVWHNFMKSLIGATAIDTFNTLVISSNSHTYSRFEYTVLANMHEILQLRLKKLRMDFLKSLTAADLKVMGSAWPLLEELEITWPIPCHLLPCLAQSFPSLQDLTFNFDGQTPLDTFVPSHTPRLPWSKVLGISVYNFLPVSFPMVNVLALCIARLFPNHDDLYIEDDDGSLGKLFETVMKIQARERRPRVRHTAHSSNPQIGDITCTCCFYEINSKSFAALYEQTSQFLYEKFFTGTLSSSGQRLTTQNVLYVLVVFDARLLYTGRERGYSKEEPWAALAALE
ncbi:LOW QUALITY PROTEIN: hypothetical protein CVT26_014284 [Gymnopilus dilepis]|uniref:Uncharacterized protein n=1 Tax=Gymnopilus dilepis TaxID=231916 RepID=A0A409Y8U2_9AGAR|nr:LOW QUALITY PROTEIN: hypothetical protein CVT26_014284 [Gymnopilus dilepis]